MDDLIKARIYKSGKREFECKILDTGERIIACALGNLVKSPKSLVPGDYVFIKKEAEENSWTIMEMEPRKTEIFRISIREQKKKTTASNCDILVILNSVSKPAFKQGIIDRFLVRAYQWGLEPIIIFNKIDEFDPDKLNLEFEQDRLKTLGLKSFKISAKFPEKSENLEELKDYLKNKTAIFLGQSGVGKSKTISLLSDGVVDLRTKKVGKAGKGKHTTTWSEIVDCQSFQLIDSPGIRSFSINDILADELLPLFPDLHEIALKCQFTNCQHDEKAQGCAFWSDNHNEYEHELLQSRLSSYKGLLEEISQKPSWSK